MLSTFLHGEQGALMTASQLVAAVPHMDGKFYASTQTMDEARHVEVFAAYVRKLGEVYPITSGLRAILDAILSNDNWMMKAVGMNIVLEGLALYSFHDMRNQTEEPLLKKLLTYVARDEARHTPATGSNTSRAWFRRSATARRPAIEDFAFEAARQLMRPAHRQLPCEGDMLALWGDAGVDPKEAITALIKERALIQSSIRKKGGSMGPVHGFVVPTLASIGLFSDRIRGHFKEMWGRQSRRRDGRTHGPGRCDPSHRSRRVGRRRLRIALRPGLRRSAGPRERMTREGLGGSGLPVSSAITEPALYTR